VYVRNLVRNSKENGIVIDHFASSGPLKVFFKENEGPVYDSKPLISVNNCQLCENGGDSIFYSDAAVALHSLTAVYIFCVLHESKVSGGG